MWVAQSATIAALVAVPSAAAHSVLVAAEPERDAVVQESPARVLLRFNEPVDASLGAPLQVFDGEGEPVDAGPVLRPRPSEVTLELGDELEQGTYTVAWRVISADSDPIRGAFVFHVGAPGANPEGVVRDVARDSPMSLDAVYRATIFSEFALLLLCVGGVAALAYPLASAAAHVRRRLHGVLAVAAAALAALSLLGLATHGAKATGGGLGEAFEWSTISASAGTRFGTVELVRAAMAGILLALALLLRRANGPRTAAGIALAALAAAIAVTPTLSGHARTAGAPAVVADIAHVAAAATWVGALAFVLFGLRFALDQRWPLATRAVPRFSTMAVVSVAALLVAGTVHGYLQVRAWRGLWDTDYGLLLLAKIALIAPLLALGAFNNRHVVPKLRAGIAQAVERRRFVRAASTELAIAVAIVGVTAFLVDTNPARHELEAKAGAAVMTHGRTGGRSSGELDFREFRATVAVIPGTVGANRIELEVMDVDPVPPKLDAVTFEASLTRPALGPLEFEAEPAGTGRWHAEQADFPIPGEWKLRAEARVGEFELHVATTEITIGGRNR